MFTRGYPRPEESSLTTERTTGEHAGPSSAGQTVGASFFQGRLLLVI
jgi:hypothetical protein